jgi:IPT/TIG domain
VPPVLTALEPPDVLQAAENSQTRVDVIGTGFTADARVNFNGMELPTAFISDTALYFTINAAPGGHATGTFPVFVQQLAEQSGTLQFTIRVSEPEPIIPPVERTRPSPWRRATRGSRPLTRQMLKNVPRRII